MSEPCEPTNMTQRERGPSGPARRAESGKV
jgi:hypothetical protein